MAITPVGISSCSKLSCGGALGPISLAIVSDSAPYPTRREPKRFKPPCWNVVPFCRIVLASA
jgi:hypothetical protein